MPTCTCLRRRAYGLTRISHRDDCPHAATGACGVCGYDVFPGEDDDHELCAAA